MAQQDSNTAAGTGRYIYYAYTDNNGSSWTSNVMSTATSFGFPCITLSNGTTVIACHQSSSVGSIVYKDIVFGGFFFSQITGIPNLPGANQPIWPHIAGTTNGNLVLAASPNDGATFYSQRTTYNGTSWSPYVQDILMGGPSGNYDVASGPNGKVAIIGTDYINGTGLYWIESNNNGLTFGSTNRILYFISEGGDSLFPNIAGGFQGVYDNTGNIHIVFAAYNVTQITFPNSNTNSFIKPGIFHWSSATNTFTRIAGKINISNLTDTITQALMAPLTQPTITKTSSGSLVCAYTTFLRGYTQVVNNGDIVNAGEIFCNASNDNGASWSIPVNITNTPNIEEKHPSMAPNSPGGAVGISYLRDMKAGGWVNVPSWGKAPVYNIFRFINFNSAPSAPTLVNPPNNSGSVSLTPLMDWNNAAFADSYMIQLARDSAFNSLIINQSVSLSQYQIGTSVLNYDSVYYWRVNATNSFGTSSWSATWNFRTITFLPQAPTVFSPVNGSTNISLTPALSWNSVVTALNYNLQVSTDSNFTGTVVNQMNISATTYTVPSSTLSAGTTYYWRVSSNNLNGTGPWSETVRFTTMYLPAAPILVSPANGSTNVPLTILLNWANVPGALRYRIQLSMDALFTTLIINDSTPTNSQFLVTGSILNYNTQYYWRVNASNSVGAGPYSDIWNFTTIVSPVPLAPILIAPANGSVNVALTPTLDWEDSEGAVSYKVQVSQDVNFSLLIVDQSGLTSSEYTIPPPILTNNTLYFWRAAGTNQNGTGQWSEGWNFRTTPVGINLISDVIPEKFGLFSNYPNPFNPSTKIRFDLPKGGFTTLNVFDIQGREIKTLVNENLSAGSYEFSFRVENLNLSCGIYFYRLISGDFVETKQMVLLK
jgi:hypothetical protein